MNAEIIAVGTEILLGDITNTHARYLAKGLATLGINLLHQSVVGDNHGRLTVVLKEALERSDIIVLTGGLGPTNNDITKETVSELMGLELEMDQEALRRIEEYFARTGRDMPSINKKQAMIPVGGTVFYNNYGTAPGIAIEKDGKCVILLPGPPRELIPMFEQQVQPFLEKFSDGKIVSHTLAVIGIGESAVAEKLGSLLEGSNPSAALYAKDGEVHIRITAKAPNIIEAEQQIIPLLGEIKNRLGDYIYGMDVPSLNHVVVRLLREQKMMIATAESCTGGMLSQRLTEISGASEVYEFGVASYSNRVKERLLGIPNEILERCGAVSSEVAMLMAAGAQRESSADIGVGITGIAGPGGGTAETPVGRVFVAVTYRNKYWVEKLSIGHGGANERDYIRSIATLHALNMVRLILEGSPRAVRALSDLPEIPIAPRVAGYLASEPIDMDKTKAEQEVAAIETEAKLPWYQRLVRYLFPWKGDAPTEIVRKVVFMVALLTLIGSSIYIADYLNAHIQADIVHNETISLYNKQPNEQELAKLPAGYLEKFAALYNKNTDIKGWVSIPNSRVNHPIVMTSNNDLYLDHDFDGNVNRYGVPFIDYRCKFGLNPDRTTQLSTNTIIYGHNGANGKVFCDAKNYYSSLTFYRGAPVITFDTVYEEAKWKVIGAFLTTGSNDGDGYFFDYHNFIEAQSKEHFDWFIRQVRSRSVLNIPDSIVDVRYGDQLLTLSTCSQQKDLNDGRIVIVARKVRKGESAAVNVSKVTTNENPQYPNAWYKQHNQQNPGWELDPNPIGDSGSSVVPGNRPGNNNYYSSQNTSSKIPDDTHIIIPSTSRNESAQSGTSSVGTGSNLTSSGGTTSAGSSSGGTTTEPGTSSTPEGGGETPGTSSTPEGGGETPGTSSTPEGGGEEPGTSSTPEGGGEEPTPPEGGGEDPAPDQGGGGGTEPTPEEQQPAA